MKTAILFLLCLSFGACAATAPAPAVESVGSLSASYGSVTSAPVARSTDLSIGFQAISADDDGPTVGGVGEAVEAPDVAPKAGLVLGAVR